MCLYLDANANVRINNITGTVFYLLRGVRQGCPVSPSFFTVALAFVSSCFLITFSGISYLAETALPFALCLAPQKCELNLFPT